MVGDRYETVNDPACYPGTQVLINLAGLRDGDALEQFEKIAVGERSLEAVPEGKFNTAHYRTIHRHLFGGVYEWAGEYRTIWTHKGQSSFAPPQHIEREMNKLFARLTNAPFLRGGDVECFIPALAEFLGDLNAIHPFREGNGRAQLVFARLLGQRAGHLLRFEDVEPDEFLHAMIESFHGRSEALVDELERLLV